MDLFKKFEGCEVKNLHHCQGGERAATEVSAANSGPNGCTKDSQQIAQTQVAGQPEGTTERDFSDWRWECGVSSGGGNGSATGVGSGISLP